MDAAEARLCRDTLTLRDLSRSMPDRGYWGTALRFTLQCDALAAMDPSGPLVVRMAKAYAAMLAQIEVLIEPLHRLAGHFAKEKVQADWSFPPVTKGDAFRPAFAFTPAVRAELDELAAVGIQPAGGSGPSGHHNPHYEAALRRGLSALADEADAAAAKLGDPQRQAASQAMAIALRGVIHFAHRHAERAEELAVSADAPRAAQLRRMAESLRRVPAAPPATFFDALQGLWLTYMAAGMSEWPSSNSWGCVDRYLFPFYQADIAAGTLTRDEARELVAHFLLKAGTTAEGQSLTLGGGADAANDLTRLFLEVVAELRMPEPVISFRMDEAVAEPTLEAAVAVAAAGTGQPSFYGDRMCRAMFTTRRVWDEDFARLSLNSCMGVIVSGAEISDMWASVTVLPLALELAISRGCTANGKVAASLAALCPARYDTFEDLWGAYERITAHMVAVAARKYRQEVAYFGRWWPNPMLSALLDDCAARGLDRFEGGPRYHSAIMEAFGWANTSDAFVAIEELVFRRGAVELPAMLAAAREDFAGREDLLNDIRQCPKYGNKDARADAMARRVLESFCTAVESQRQAGDTIEFLPSLHTLSSHVHTGQGMAATLDGRRRGAALNKQLGPSVWAVRNGPTGVLGSATHMPIERLTGGQALDISVPHSMLIDAGGRGRFKALLRAYFAMGGSHLQVNTASPAELRAAQEKPAEHGDLIVRIGGYSTYFNRLNRACQDDLIARIEAGV